MFSFACGAPWVLFCGSFCQSSRIETSHNLLPPSPRASKCKRRKKRRWLKKKWSEEEKSFRKSDSWILCNRLSLFLFFLLFFFSPWYRRLQFGFWCSLKAKCSSLANWIYLRRSSISEARTDSLIADHRDPRAAWLFRSTFPGKSIKFLILIFPLFFFGATVLQSWRCAITDRNVTQLRNNLSLLPSKNFLLLKGEESTNETVSKTKGIEAINFFNWNRSPILSRETISTKNIRANIPY